MDRATSRIIKTVAILCLVAFTPGLQAEQTIITDYNDARDNYFYDQLYIGTIGESLYCGIQRPIQDSIGKQRSLEHVMPAYWFGHQLQCWQEGGRKACKKIKHFREMEGDLHNLQPAIGELNGDRPNYRFAMLEDEVRNYGACNFEVNFKARKVEPPPNVRGDIARTHFYMSERCELKLSKQQRGMFEAWNKSDPPSQYEHWRNKNISEILRYA